MNLYKRHGELVQKYFDKKKLTVHEIVELAHIRRKLDVIQMKEMFGVILNDVSDMRLR